MDLKRIFRGWTLAILAAVLLLIVVYRFTSSGPQFKQTDTSQVIKLVETGQVKSAVLNENSQNVQIVTNTNQALQASFVTGQGLQLANRLQADANQGKLPDGYKIGRAHV